MEDDWNPCLQTLEGHSQYVSSVAFSPDGRQLASASGDKTVKLWDAATGHCLQTLEGGRTLRHLSFDPTGAYLHTNTGTIGLHQSPHKIVDNITNNGPKSLYQGYGISTDGVWITWKSTNWLWLPSEYRPRSSAIAEAASTVALGCSSGRVLLFQLSTKHV